MIKIIVNKEKGFIQILDKNSGKLLYQIGIDKNSLPMDNGDIEVQYIPEEFDSDEK